MLARHFADLDTADPDAFRALPNVQIVRTEDYGQLGTSPNSLIRFPSLAIFCYRVDVNRTMRASWSAVAHHDRTIHLPLDAHFLLTPFDTFFMARRWPTVPQSVATKSTFMPSRFSRSAVTSPNALVMGWSCAASTVTGWPA